MNSFATEAVVLKRRDFGEADRLVTFFTKRKGKVVALAKGVRKVTSRRAPNIELLNHVRILQGSFQIKLLTQVGYLPELYRCAKCGDPLVPQDNFLSPNIGGLVDEACNRQTL